MPWDFHKDGETNFYGDSNKCSDIAYPTSCCHNVLMLSLDIIICDRSSIGFSVSIIHSSQNTFVFFCLQDINASIIQIIAKIFSLLIVLFFAMRTSYVLFLKEKNITCIHVTYNAERYDFFSGR